MARLQRIEYEGAVYHVTARGNERRALFGDDGDRERFLRVLGESVASFEIRLYLFCLMTTHLHLVLETPRGNLGRFMHRLQTAYTVYFNHRHRRQGHLLPGRRRDALDRALAARLLCDYGGLTQREAATVLGLRSGAAVSAQLQNLAQRLSTDPALRRQMAALAAQLKTGGR